MNVTLLAIGKTDKKELQLLVDIYIKRLKHYINFQFEALPDLKKAKNLGQEQQQRKEAEILLKKIQPTDAVFLLDEHGKDYTSEEFADFLQKQMNAGIGRLVLVIGGPYGFAPEMYDRANGKISLSRMTFSHQMVRLFMVEQLYRAFSILRNEPYHHR